MHSPVSKVVDLLSPNLITFRNRMLTCSLTLSPRMFRSWSIIYFSDIQSITGTFAHQN